MHVPESTKAPSSSPTAAHIRPVCSLGVMLELRYTHPRAGADVEIRQAVRVPRDLPFDLKIGERVGLVCWGVMPSGMLRHPVLRAER